MFRDLPAHAAVKDTGLSWAPAIPDHWAVKRAKTIMRAIDIRSETGEEELLTVSSSRGVVPRASANVNMFKAESYIGHKLCWPDDLVINSLWAWGRGIGVAKDHGIVSTAYGVYRQHKQALLPAYLHQLVRSEPFNWELQVRSQGVWKSRLQMTDDRWLDAPLLVPPLEEQVAIVKYLAHANARIDNAIAAKRRLISLLEEQQRGVVHETIKRVAADTVPIKRAVQSMTAGLWGASPEESSDPHIWCVRVADFDYAHNAVASGPKTLRAVNEKESNRKSLRQGDLLLEGSGGGDKTSVGRVVLFDHEELAVCSNFLQRLRPREGVHSGYLAHVLRDLHSTGSVRMYIKQTTGIQNLDLDAYRSILIPMPDIAAQAAISREIEESLAESDSVVDRVNHEIELIHEFRTRLVADVVTGQRDVRAIAATLPDAPADSMSRDVDTPAVDDGLDVDVSMGVA